MHALRRTLSTCLVLAISLGALTGCKITSDDIDTWTRTVKGPGKIVAVILADRYPMELRQQAALALVRMDRTDRNGVEMLKQAVDRLKESDEEAVKTIIDGIASDLIALMEGEETVTDDNLGPPAQQIRAKDSAYFLIPYANAETRAQLTRAVVAWYARDFANRSLSGDYSVEQVVRTLGAPAARQLIDAMDFRVPAAALVKISELIGQIGDDETKRLAGEKLVEIETAMEVVDGPFIEWLKGEVRAAFEASDREVDDNYVALTASTTRERIITTGALPAMKHLASVDSVRARLMTIAMAAPPEGSPDGAVVAINNRRQTALMALEGNARSSELSQLLDLALNESNAINVRDYAFDRVGDIGDRAAIPRLWPLVINPSNEDLPKRLRWRGGELVLSLGGPDVVPEFFSKLPSDSGVEYEPQELEGYATQISQMTRQPTQVVENQLSAQEWYKRVIALRFIERRGSEADVSKMQRLVRDQAAVVGDGWAGREITNVGGVAESAIAALRERLASPTTAAPAESEDE